MLGKEPSEEALATAREDANLENDREHSKISFSLIHLTGEQPVELAQVTSYKTTSYKTGKSCQWLCQAKQADPA